MPDPDAPAARQEFFFEDLQVGQKFLSGTQTVDVGQIIAFARQFDPQPFHLDQQAAKDSFFGGLIASGWHTAAITMRLLVESGLNIPGGMIGAGGEIVWPKPTRPGAVLQVETEVIDTRTLHSKPDRGIVSVRCITRDQQGEILQTMVARLYVPRRPEDSTSILHRESHE
jgi:acyl dehydratase